jgi:hypothetical protein
MESRVRDTVVVEALCYKPDGRGFEARAGEWIFSIYLLFPAALGSASNRNEYQKQKIMFLGSRERPVSKADNLTAISETTV